MRGTGQPADAALAAGLEALEPRGPATVLIHDAARPFLTVETIGAVIDALGAAEGAFPCLPVVDALWRAEDGWASASPG